MRDARSEPGMTKQTTEHGETDNRAWRNRQPGMTAHQSLPAATGNLINPTVTPTYPPVTPDLYSSHTRPDRGSPRLRSRAGREKKPAKRMVKGALLTLGLPDRAN